MRTKQKILQVSKARLLTFGFAILFNTILAASVCGTFAWYAYATRTGFEKQYHGVTLGDTGSVGAGIISNVVLDEYEQFELIEDKETLADENKIIYWFGNELLPEGLNYIIGQNGSATSVLHPVTTGSDAVFGSDDDFHLFRSPAYLRDYKINEDYYAEKEDFVFIPFVFRYKNPDISPDFIPNRNIFFKECELEVNENNPESEIYKSVRVCADNGTSRYLINPSADSDGFNAVGGILDLNKDGFYDYFSDEEFIYGETEHYDINSDYTENDGTLSEENRTTFLSNHKAGVRALNESTFAPSTIGFNSMRTFVNGNTPVTITDANYHNLARLDFYVFVEGWDLHVIDQEIGLGFNVNINFGVALDE